VNAAVQTAHGVYVVDLDEEEVLSLEEGAQLPPAPALSLSLPLLVDAAASGSTVVAVLDRRPPLAVSYDAGRTWHEAGGGLARGRAVAIAQDDPDLVLYGARNRLYLSRDGGRFWSGLALELPEIKRVAFVGDAGSSRAP
jgi:hypothetical protein